MDFNHFATDYEDRVESAAGIPATALAGEKARLILQVLAQKAHTSSDLCILDIGCGVGLLTRELEHKVALACGVDLSIESLKYAKIRAPGAQFYVCDSAHLPFADGTFDAAITVCVLHHVPPDKRVTFMAEMTRVLRPLGIAIIIEHNPFNPITRLIVSRCEFDEDATLLTCRQTRTLLTGARFTAIKRRYIGFSPVRGLLVERAERLLCSLPLGAQYCIWGSKSTE